MQSAKSNRSKRLKEEKSTETTFAKAEGFNREDLASVQRAVNRLAKSGSDLDSGKLTDVATALRYVQTLESRMNVLRFFGLLH